jgi:hypothetical protein
VGVEWLLATGDALHVVLEADTDEERAQADAVPLPPMTPAESQLLRTTAARWIKADPCPFPDRLERLRELARMMDEPLERFGTQGKLDPRSLSDYRLSMLTALGLGMPPRK